MPLEEDHDQATGDPTAGSDGVDRLRRLLGSLSPDERIVVVLRYEADLTVPAIAALIGVAEGTVKSRLHHALARLRAIEEAQRS